MPLRSCHVACRIARNPGNEVVHLNYAAVNPALTNEKCDYWHFRLDVDTTMKMEALTTVMKDQPKVKDEYLLNQNYSQGQQVAKYFKEGISRKRPDVKIAGKDLHLIGQAKEFTPYVAKIKQSGTDTIVTGNWGADLTPFVKTLNDASLTLSMYTPAMRRSRARPRRWHTQATYNGINLTHTWAAPNCTVVRRPPRTLEPVAWAQWSGHNGASNNEVFMNEPACMVWLPMDHRLLGDPEHTMPYLVLGDKYARAVKRCADAQRVLFPLAEAQQIPALLALVDGVMLTGSASNVHPSHFEQSISDPALPLDPQRDALTLALVHACVEQHVPLLGVCRGFQEINVALGGSLHQQVQQVPDMMDHRELPHESAEQQYGVRHEVGLLKGSVFALWAGAESAQVNSLHGQGIALGAGFACVGLCTRWAGRGVRGAGGKCLCLRGAMAPAMAL